MTERKLPVLPLIAMGMVYLLCTLATFRWFQKNLMLVWEHVRDPGLSLTHWAVIAGPLAGTLIMLAATIIFWSKGQRRVSYALSAGLLTIAVAIVTLFRGPTA